MTRVWRQVRDVRIGDIDFSQFDLSVDVTKPSSDPLEYDLTIYNLTDETWDRISDDDMVRIELGWEETETDVLAFGDIDKRYRTRNGQDLVYRIKGVDATEKAVDSSFSARWRDARPDAIVEDIAGQLGLAAETDRVPRPITGLWSMHSERPVKEWLDELVEYAEEFSGVEWEWFAEAGTLYFIEANSTVGDAPKLSYNGMLLDLSKKNRQDSSSETLEFEAMLDPRITKGAAVVVDTDRHNGTYKVENYEFESSSLSGDHLVSGDIEPTDEVSEYDPNPPSPIPDEFRPF